ncbi:protein ROLLING AND ERECT LEAF 2-like [Phoenix dactylifera]|uniref:Protein ROLLING AND ERECT LEAF 2-like n=1 Tax=Phoenix dactylifera TaxID=42345 RepID=A0A8B7CIW0_PHODC|nr:protein ROLLING AND ERECT LEAF 2-like [Phoenix dactylifera]
MGCAQSRVDNEEAVTRCRERKQWMKEAVTARNAFAAAHSAYAVSLKNTGAALSEFGQGEVAAIHTSTAAAGTVGHHSAAASTSAAASVQPPVDTLPPPPPPLPDFSPSPLQRSISMPDIPPSEKFPSKFPPEASIREEEEEEDDDAGGDGGDLEDHRRHRRPAAASPSPSPSPAPPPPPHTPPPPPMPAESTWDYFFAMDENMPGPSLGHPEEIGPERAEAPEEGLKRSAPSPPPPAIDHEVAGADDDSPMTPEKVVLEPPLPPKLGKKQKPGGTVHHQHAASAPPVDAKRGKMVAFAAPSINLLQVLTDIDDHFLKASESAHEVSKMLEATRLHYHSNFADNRGHIDHSAIVLRVITWNKSFKGIPHGNDGRDDFDNDEWETHAIVLDKMLAWEKKLYDEVKAGELMKIEYQRKVALLNRQKKRGAGTEALERTKAAVSHLHTRYIVDMQSMDSTVSEVERLRDEQLYPKLVELADGMAKMWEAMYVHHDNQLKIVLNLKILDITNVPKETSEHHYKRTLQLFEIVKEWHSQFDKLVSHQKDYIRALNNWLKLNIIPIESSLKERVSSPPRPRQPPIQALLLAWHDHLEKIPDELAKSAILSFSAVINTIVILQQEELKQKEKCDETRKEYLKKARAFEDWYSKYSQRRATALSEEAVQEDSEAASQKDPVAERKFAVESVKSRLDEEEDNHRKLCKQVREKSFGSLKTHLPELFRAMSDFAYASSDMYMKLKSISQGQNPVTN